MLTMFEPPRILAIDPGTRFLGIAVLEADDLVYYGVKDLREKRPASQLMRTTREVLRELIDRYEPKTLAYEKSFYVQSKASVLLQRQEAEIARIGQAAKLRVVASLPSEARAVVCHDAWATKAMVAEHLVRRFPDLARYHPLPDEQRARYWLHMFDALAVAVAAGQPARKVNPTSGGRTARAG